MHLRPLTGRRCLITGANAGIGKATALGLARLGAGVVIVARSRERGEAAREEIAHRSGNSRVELLVADLSSQTAVRRLAEQYRARYAALDVLINNAGIIPPERELTEDGLERQLAVNHLAPVLLTSLLLDLIEVSAPARIITVSSEMHRYAPPYFDPLDRSGPYHPRRTYAWTKLANILFTYHLARRPVGNYVTVNCLHPGVVATKLLRAGLPAPLRFATNLVGVGIERGAETPIYLASAPELATVSGGYFIKCRPARSSPASYDEDRARRLWELSAGLVGL